jgi:uncharacterized protein YaaR (DUF327 family)
MNYCVFLNPSELQLLVHKINALVREQKDFVDEDEINSNTPPADVMKFISNQINEMGSVLKDDQICKVVKRMKKMVSYFCATSNGSSFAISVLILVMLSIVH